MENAAELISKRLRQLRENKKLSQKEICDGTHIKQSQYSLIENGKVEPSVTTLFKIADFLKISVVEIFQDDNSSHQSFKYLEQLTDDDQKFVKRFIELARFQKRVYDFKEE